MWRHRHHRGGNGSRRQWRYMNPLSRYLRKRMHRRIFFWFGASILLTMVASVGVMGAFGSNSWRHTMDDVEGLAADRFERVWDDPAARAELASALSSRLELDLAVRDAASGEVQQYGALCRHVEYRIHVTRGGQALGTVEACAGRHHASGMSFLLPFGVAALVLWAASGRIARSLTRPLGELTRVTQEIGAGNLKARAQVNPFLDGEASVLGGAINDMAGRIEKQMGDQRELLAAVSHELRTPLARIRLLTELARTGGAERKTLDDLDREVMEIDALVGDLLASSRLDFSALSIHRLEVAAVTRRALERAGVSAEKLTLDALDAQVDGDATLLARALANLLDNAQRHGGGVAAVHVRATASEVAFEVEDAGPGFDSGEPARAFDAFWHRPKDAERDAGGLGLGLSLVKRIAEAHGGRAYAENRPEGGARVGFAVRRA
jgi:two-component system OmpR family sensor kinase